MTWPTYSPACIADVVKALKGPLVSAYRSNKAWGVGPREDSNVYAFERAAEKYFAVKHAIGMNSGTMALVAAIKALELPRGSGIVTTPYTFSATAAAVVLSGHIPQFADVDPYHFCLDPVSVKRAMTRKTRAILNVDLFGYLPDYAPLKALGVPVIQDGCQSAGAIRNGRRVHGVISCGSGNGQKNVPCVEGGWALTDDAKLAERMREYITHAENFGSREPTVNGRMHELVALLARHGLKDLDERNERRRSLANAFDALTDASVRQSFQRGCVHVFYCTPFALPRGVDRARFIKRCARRGVTIGAGYVQPPIHHYPAFRRYATRKLPVVDELSSKTLCLIYSFTPDQPLSHARKVAKVVAEALR